MRKSLPAFDSAKDRAADHPRRKPHPKRGMTAIGEVIGARACEVPAEEGRHRRKTP